MAVMANFISKLEEYGDLEVSIIRSTKINKVLKALIKLNTIPKDEEFDFKGRSMNLLARWNKALGADAEAAGPPAEEKADQPTTNGAHKEDKDSEAKQEVTAGGEETTETLPNDTVESKEDENADASKEIIDTPITTKTDSVVPEEATEEIAGDAEPTA
jgi:hypothetical protein